MFSRCVFALAMVSVLAHLGFAQEASSTPKNFRLASGYTWTETKGGDAVISKLARDDGFTITHISPAVKNFYQRAFESRKDLAWLKNQTLSGHKITVGSFNNGEMLAVVDDTQVFRATPTRLDQAADLLLIIATFDSKKEAFASSPQAAVKPPGNIQLLPGYTYQPRPGKDSSVGSMTGDSGLMINHDIGRMAGNYAGKYFPEHFERLRKQTHLNNDAIEQEINYLEKQIDWRIRQEVNGDELMVVYRKDSTLIASFVRSTANFTTTVDSFDKLTDFFLTILTYQPNLPNKLPK